MYPVLGEVTERYKAGWSAAAQTVPSAYWLLLSRIQWRQWCKWMWGGFFVISIHHPENQIFFSYLPDTSSVPGISAKWACKECQANGRVLVCVLFYVCSMSDGLLSNLLLLSEAAVCVVPLRQYMEVYWKRNPTCYLFINLCYSLLNKHIALAIYTCFSFDAYICCTTPFNHHS